MRNPTNAFLLFDIESRIAATDLKAKEAGITLTDSQIRSALVKARKFASSGAAPAIPATANVRDRLLADLAIDLAAKLPQASRVTVDDDGTEIVEPLPLQHWLDCIVAVEDSIKTRASITGEPGWRGYLDFLHPFLAKASGTI